MDRPLYIAVTGGLASGKSTFCQYLNQLGWPLVSADTLGHQALALPVVINALQSAFGPGISQNGQINRQALGQQVFGNQQAVNTLNAIVHPHIRQLMQQQMQATTGPVLVLEIPLLYESNLQNCFDYRVAVIAPANKRIERFCQRTGLSRHQALERIASQVSDKTRQQADLVVNNNASLDNLYTQAQNLVNSLPQLPYRQIEPLPLG